jgi:hypothetical protein
MKLALLDGRWETEGSCSGAEPSCLADFTANGQAILFTLHPHVLDLVETAVVGRFRMLRMEAPMASVRA